MDEHCFGQHMLKVVQMRLMWMTQQRNLPFKLALFPSSPFVLRVLRAWNDSPHSEPCAGTQRWAGHCRCYSSSLWTSLRPPHPQTSSSSETGQKQEYDLKAGWNELSLSLMFCVCVCVCASHLNFEMFFSLRSDGSVLTFLAKICWSCLSERTLTEYFGFSVGNTSRKLCLQFHTFYLSINL